MFIDELPFISQYRCPHSNEARLGSGLMQLLLWGCCCVGWEEMKLLVKMAFSKLSEALLCAGKPSLLSLWAPLYLSPQKLLQTIHSQVPSVLSSLLGKKPHFSLHPEAKGRK